MAKEEKNSLKNTSSSSYANEQYDKEALFRHVQKYGIAYFSDANCEVTAGERGIIKQILNGESLESFIISRHA